MDRNEASLSMCRRQKSKKGMNECVKASALPQISLTAVLIDSSTTSERYGLSFVRCEGSWSLIVSMTTTGVSLLCSAWSMAASRKDWFFVRDVGPRCCKALPT